MASINIIHDTKGKLMNKDDINWLRETSGMGSREHKELSVEVRGKRYTLMVETQEEHNNRKFIYHVVDEEGNRHQMDWSPYQVPTADEVRVWVLLGMPQRSGSAPLSREDLNRMYRMKVSQGQLNQGR